LQSSVAADSRLFFGFDLLAILVTRPYPDGETTAANLRARGFEALVAPMLRFEPTAFHEEAEARYGAVIVTSANALRGIQSRLEGHAMLDLPLFAVGEHTATFARSLGFKKVISAKGDAATLRDCVLAGVKAKTVKKATPLLYLAGADLARDLAGELGERGFTVVTQTTYRMVPVAELPREAGEAIAASRIEAVLHYSRRSARAFLHAVRAAGVEITALSVPQCCISAGVAAVIRDAGATQVLVAASPDENALFSVLERALPP
jgi:uroporphyrinogen-III synthase